MLIFILCNSVLLFNLQLCQLTRDGEVYHDYCLNYPKAVCYLEQLRKNEDFGEFEKVKINIVALSNDLVSFALKSNKFKIFMPSRSFSATAELIVYEIVRNCCYLRVAVQNVQILRCAVWMVMLVGCSLVDWSRGWIVAKQLDISSCHLEQRLTLVNGTALDGYRQLRTPMIIMDKTRSSAVAERLGDA